MSINLRTIADNVLAVSIHVCKNYSGPLTNLEYFRGACNNPGTECVKSGDKSWNTFDSWMLHDIQGLSPKCDTTHHLTTR